MTALLKEYTHTYRLVGSYFFVAFSFGFGRMSLFSASWQLKTSLTRLQNASRSSASIVSSLRFESEALQLFGSITPIVCVSPALIFAAASLASLFAFALLALLLRFAAWLYLTAPPFCEGCAGTAGSSDDSSFSDACFDYGFFLSAGFWGTLTFCDVSVSTCLFEPLTEPLLFLVAAFYDCLSSSPLLMEPSWPGF